MFQTVRYRFVFFFPFMMPCFHFSCERKNVSVYTSECVCVIFLLCDGDAFVKIVEKMVGMKIADKDLLSNENTGKNK